MSARLAFYLTPPEKRRTLVDLLRKHFVLLDVDGYAPGGSSEEVAWWTRVSGHAENDGCGNNNWYLATASGRRLADPVNRGLPNLEKVWSEWSLHPEADRRPKLPKPIQDRPKSARLTPPPGALILRVYFSYLDTLPGGEVAPVKRTRWNSEIMDSRFPGTDTMWITEKEWTSMAPAAPRKGDPVPFPITLQNRILAYYTAPELIGWNNRAYGEVRGAEFSLTVEEVTAGGFRLRLEGFARKGKPFDPKGIAPEGGDFRFLGFPRYDSKKKAFDRFDVIALGKAWGGSGEDINGGGKGPRVEYVPIYERAGRPYSSGIAFELVSGERPADRVPPGPGANGYPGWAPEIYFGKERN
jgi:hypothetical protein